MWKIDIEMHRFLDSCTRTLIVFEVSKEISNIRDCEPFKIILPDPVTKIMFPNSEQQKRNRPSTDSEDQKRTGKRQTNHP